MLETPDHPAFPVDAKQLLYLITNGYITQPTISKADIEDRNKADGLARFDDPVSINDAAG